MFETDLHGLVHRGKVRDTYDLGDGLLLMVATDRISAFDVVMAEPVPGKGVILAQMSNFWFDLLDGVVPHHRVALVTDKEAMKKVPVTGALDELPQELVPRSMVIRRAERIDMECVVRAYIAGTAWVEYGRSGTMNGELLPEGLREAERLPEPRFTPSTKDEFGHDEALSRAHWLDAPSRGGDERLGARCTERQKLLGARSPARGPKPAAAAAG